MRTNVAFKVLRDDLTSVGLLGAPRMQYVFDEWNKPGEKLSAHPRKGGGLWVAPTKACAKAMLKYLLRKHGIKARIFRCRIGRVLYRTSCRIKTAAVFFSPGDEIID